MRTPRLWLRRQTPADAAFVKEAVDASVTHLKTTVAWAQAAPFPLSVLAARLADAVVAFDAGREWAFSIYSHDGTRALGAVAMEPGEPALNALVGQGVIEVGYWLRADAVGHGYATEATWALIDLAFTILRAPSIAICHDPSNAPSAGIPRRLGFIDWGAIPNEQLPDRRAADGSLRQATRVWVLHAPPLCDHARRQASDDSLCRDV